MARYLPDPRVGIVGTGFATPERQLTNLDLEKMVDTSDEWIIERTGIRTRYISDENTTTSTLAVAAARKAMAEAGVEAEEIDLIIVGTATPDMPFPSTACLIQAELGATNAAGFDLAAACSGFIYGLSVAAGQIRSGMCRTALVIGAETLTKIVDFEDRATCVLFGDGAGAAIVRAVPEDRGLLALRMRSDGTLADMLKLPGGGSLHPTTHETVDARLHYIQMTGNSVFKSAVRSMAAIAMGAIEDAGLRPDDIDLFIPHQANLRIIVATGKKVGIPSERVYVNVDRFGNTSAASIPIAISEARASGVLQDGMTVAVVAFGSGFTFGSAVHQF